MWCVKITCWRVQLQLRQPLYAQHTEAVHQKHEMWQLFTGLETIKQWTRLAFWRCTCAHQPCQDYQLQIVREHLTDFRLETTRRPMVRSSTSTSPLFTGWEVVYRQLEHRRTQQNAAAIILKRVQSHPPQALDTGPAASGNPTGLEQYPCYGCQPFGPDHAKPLRGWVQCERGAHPLLTLQSETTLLCTQTF